MAIQGIRSVDFILRATGEGVVNANGAFKAYNPAAGQVVENHMFPKLRGMDPMQRLANANGEGSMLPSLSDPKLAEAELVVSAECVRAGLFKDVSFGVRAVTPDNVAQVLASLHGLVRGYLITEGGRNFPRKSPLYVTDMACANPGLVFNQGTNSKSRGSDKADTSIYSYFKTNGNLDYRGKASLSVEELQFIPMDNRLGRSAFEHVLSESTGEQVAAGVTAFLRELARKGLEPQVTFVRQARRVGALAYEGESGLLLNDDALRVVIDELVAMFQGLYIRQSKGFLQVTEVVVDYNDSNRVFRAEADPGAAVSVDTGSFARYYVPVEVDAATFEQAMERQKAAQAGEKAKKADKKKPTKGDASKGEVAQS